MRINKLNDLFSISDGDNFRQASFFVSITDLLKWLSQVTYSFFERKPCNQVSGVRFKVSGFSASVHHS